MLWRLYRRRWLFFVTLMLCFVFLRLYLTVHVPMGTSHSPTGLHRTQPSRPRSLPIPPGTLPSPLRGMESPPSSNSMSHSGVGWVTGRPPGRLGNAMFGLASMLGVAHRTGLVPGLAQDSELWQYFQLRLAAAPAHPPGGWTQFPETRACAYDRQTQYLNSSANIELVGFFQSWAYFDQIQPEIRKQFTFKHPILNIAQDFVRKAVEHSYRNMTAEDLTLVGVHIRRGDLIEEDNDLKGYTTAPWQYIQVAMAWFEAKYETVLFIVCSDDQGWSQTHVRRQQAPIVFSENYHPAEDLAILSLCHHMVITVGTFGWWAAWLAGGSTIYFRDFPRKHSILDQVFVREDYYPPKWIGLS